MIIERLELSNWGPHVSKDLDMNASIVGILGSNGKGKSNILHAIAYALTGDTGPGKATAFIHNFGGAGAAKKASVKLTFRKGGEIGVITRIINDTGTSKRELTWKGNSYKSAADVERTLTEILGADKAAILQAVYIKQGDIDRLVKGTPGERQEVFLKLMNLSFIESRVDQLRKRIAIQKTGLQDYTQAKSVLEDEIKKDNEAIKAYEETVNKYSEAHLRLTKLQIIHDLMLQHASTSRQEDTLRAKLADDQYKLNQFNLQYDPNGELENNCKKLADDETALNTRIFEINSILAKSEDKAKLFKELTEKIVEKATNIPNPNFNEAEVNASIMSLESELVLINQQLDLENRIKIAKEAQTKNHLALSTAAGEFSQADKNRMSELENEINTLIRMITIGELSTDDTCPICGTKMPAIVRKQALEGLETNKTLLTARKDEKARLDKKKTDCDDKLKRIIIGIQTQDGLIKEWEAQLLPQERSKETVQSEIATLRSSITDYHVKTTKTISIEARINAIQSQLKELDSIPSVTTNLNAEKQELENRLNDIVTNKNTYQANLQTKKSYLAVLASTEEQCEAISVKFNKEAEKINECLNLLSKDIAISENCNITEIEALAENYTTQETEYVSAKSNLDLVRDQLAEHNLRLAEIDEQISINSKKIQLIEDLQSVVTLTCKTGIPLAYANEVFKYITTNVQDLLERMQANFTVVVDEDRPLTYKFMRTDDTSGYEMAQERLSGGQAIRLSIALLIACQQAILPEVGLLILDEPSSHIDAEGVEHMREMFMQLEELLENSNMQLIVVDHNSILESAFERTINL